jgi:hypothetical protein
MNAGNPLHVGERKSLKRLDIDDQVELVLPKLAPEVMHLDLQRTGGIAWPESALQAGEPIQTIAVKTHCHRGNVSRDHMEAQVSEQMRQRGQATSWNPDRPEALYLHALHHLWQLLDWDTTDSQI